MDHEEKVQMLDEVQEIRQLILKLNKANATSENSTKLSATGNGGGVPFGRGKRVLDLF